MLKKRILLELFNIIILLQTNEAEYYKFVWAFWFYLLRFPEAQEITFSPLTLLPFSMCSRITSPPLKVEPSVSENMSMVWIYLSWIKLFHFT